MTKSNHLLIGLAMLIAAGLTFAITPREKVADSKPKIDLEILIPGQFGEWRIDKSVVPLQISPEVQANLDRIYNQILSRTYVNAKNERIMLSVAYGGDQSDSMQVHKPEICYPAQGFQILKQFDLDYQTGFGVIPVRRLIAAQGNRVEPITYWTTIGDRVAQGTARKIEQLKYGLTGKVPDGLLFRVSNISRDEAAAFAAQDDFIKALLGSQTPAQRVRIIGQSADQPA